MADDVLITVGVQGKEKVDQTTKSLDKMAFSAKKLERDIAKFSASSSSVAKGVENVAQKVDRATTSMNKFGGSTTMATRGMNRSGMVMQQAGYQIGDFIVQVQSGTNAFVAFGQQATQMAGLLGVMSQRLIPLSLILSVTIPLVTAIGAAISRTSEKTTRLSFDFEKFGQDVKKGLEPLAPLWRGLASVFNWLKERLLDGINLIINGFRYLGVMIGTIPDAFSAAFGTIDQLMTSFALRTRSLTMSVMSMWQAMKDFIAGSTTMRPVINFDAAGNASEGQIPLTDFYKESAAALNSQVAQLEENMKAGSGAKVMSDALSNFEPIDIRDYFSRVAVDDGKGGSKSSEKTFQELLSALEKENNLNRELIGVYGDKRNVLETVNEFEKELNRNLTENEIKKVEIAAKEQYRIEQMSQLMDTVSGHIESAFMSFVDGSKSVEDAFKSMLRNIILAIYQEKVAKAGANAIMSLLGLANGGAFERGGKFTAYANGGVVGSPTMFSHSGGLGVMGEAGPEAIMPLKRGKNGKLGVQMEGNAGNVTVVQNFNMSANGDESVKRIIRQETPRIAEQAKAAVVDAKRRGGSYGRSF
jgi:hypothetical protein